MSRTPRRISSGAPLRIQAVAELTGVAAPTLRAWERRYGIPVPDRSASAYRLYGPADVAEVREMTKLVAAGVAPSQAAARIAESRPGLPPDPGARGRSAITAPHAFVAADRLVVAARTFDAAALDREVTIALDVGDPITAFEQVLAPALYALGDLWAKGVVSIAHEHFASERIGTALRVQLRAMQPASSDRLALLAAFEEEEHVIPLLGVALRFATWGYRTLFLGARTPPSAVAVAVRETRPSIIGLSCMLAPEPRRAAPLVAAYGRAASGVPWLVGGSAAEALARPVARAGGLAVTGSLREMHVAVREVLTRRPNAPARARDRKAPTHAGAPAR